VFGSGFFSGNTSGFGKGLFAIEDEDEIGTVDFGVAGGVIWGLTIGGGGSLNSFWISLGTIGLKSLEDRCIKDFSLPQCEQGIFNT
jgi:hypothetical protein